MSFSSETKSELCKNQIVEKCCAQAELYGVFLFCNTMADTEIKIMTGSRDFARRLPKLVKKAYGFSFDRQPEEEKEGAKSIFQLTDAKKLSKIFESLGYTPGMTPAHHINFGVLEEEHCRVSFLRGAFLAGGSVTNPQKGYHLELSTTHRNVSREIHSILLDLGFYPKEVIRNGSYITYFKQSDVLEVFLTTIGASVAAMEIMSTKIEKDMTNSVNRRVNCDTANVTKTVEAAAEQLWAIGKLQKSGVLDTMPEKLRETAKLRYDNPELSLQQLAETFTPPVTKSGLSHRLRKLIQAAKELKEEE